MLVLAGIVLVGVAVAFVLSPFVAGHSAPLTDGPDRVAELRELYTLRELHYETLRDIEFDFHAGKIGRADHDEMTGRTSREATQVVARIDALEAALGVPAPRRTRGR